MPDFWIDTCCLIDPYRVWYKFDVVPGYWTFLENGNNTGLLSSCRLVYEELEKGQLDELVRWARQQRDSGFFVEPDDPVMAFVGAIGEYVRSLPFEEPAKQEFMDGADPWLIAHAKVHGGTIVTQENTKGAAARPKIPVIAQHFGLAKPLTAPELLRSLNVKFQ